MKIASHPRFSYISLRKDEAWCSVDVYLSGSKLLVVLRDQDEDDDLTNNIESVAWDVYHEVVNYLGLRHMETYWIHWSRADRMASTVTFENVYFENPHWQHLSLEEFQKKLAEFGAPDQLEQWMREGTLELKDWKESGGIHRRETE